MITQNRTALNQLTAVLPDDSKVIMSSLRQFSGTQPLYTLGEDGVLTNNQTHVKYRPNNDVGFYQSINADGSWGNEKLSPGYTVTIGWDNFTRVFHDEGIQKPFFAIFVWTVVFSVLTVVLTVAVGMIRLPGAVGSAERQSDLSRPADSAVRRTVVYFDSDFQRAVQPELW